MSWTDERVTLLKKLWCEGKTAAEIAKELGDVTRNAVIGKAHRLKLSNRVSPIQQNKKPVVVSGKAQPVLIERKAPKEVSLQDNRQGVPLLDLKAQECRWPLGDPRDKNFGFCGHASVAGFPYCAEHARSAYQAQNRTRVLKVEDLEKDVGRAEERDVMRKVGNQ